jgi:hypothetical protein
MPLEFGLQVLPYIEKAQNFFFFDKFLLNKVVNDGKQALHIVVPDRI